MLTKKLKEFSSSIDNLAAKNTTLAEAMAKVSTSFETLKAGYVDVDGNLSEVFNKNFSDLKDSISNLEKSVRTNKKLKTAKATVGKTSGVNRILRRILGWNKR